MRGGPRREARNGAPSAALAAIREGDAHWRSGDTLRARREFERALVLDPAIRAPAMLSGCWTRSRATTPAPPGGSASCSAITPGTRCVERARQRQQARAQVGRGGRLLSARDRARAELASALSNLGICLRNRAAKARRWTTSRRAAALEPGNPEIQFNSCLGMIDAGRAEEGEQGLARVLARAAARRGPSRARLSSMLAAGRYAKAGGSTSGAPRRDLGAPQRGVPVSHGGTASRSRAAGCWCARSRVGRPDHVRVLPARAAGAGSGHHSGMRASSRAVFARSFRRLRRLRAGRRRRGAAGGAGTGAGSAGQYREPARPAAARGGRVSRSHGLSLGGSRRKLARGASASPGWARASRSACRGAAGPGTRATSRVRSRCRTGSIAARGIGAFRERAGRRLRGGNRGAGSASGDAALHHWPEALRDYDETVALTAALDLVVSVQTTVVHLSGALGTPVWVMVPGRPEWRYTRAGKPCRGIVGRLVRQQASGDWGTVIDRVARDLSRLEGRGT